MFFIGQNAIQGVQDAVTAEELQFAKKSKQKRKVKVSQNTLKTLEKMQQ